MALVDTHAHLEGKAFDEDRDKVIKKAFAKDVRYIVNVGSDIESSRKSIDLAKKYEGIYAAVGIHPHDAKDAGDDSFEELARMCKKDKVLAIGEIGLDYHYDNSPRDLQKKVFRRQINLAREASLPIVVHSREAEDDTLNILGEEDAKEVGGIMHCFSGSREMAEKTLDMGFYISVAGPVTFKKAHGLRDIVDFLPLNRILAETDSPYLAPVPRRGKRNEPSYLVYTVEKLVEIRGKEVLKAIIENAGKVFGVHFGEL